MGVQEDSFRKPSGRQGVLDLIQKQNKEFPKIYTELLINKRKTTDWAWWVWPTTLEGSSEPWPKTPVRSDEVRYLLEHCPILEWTNILKLINKLIEEQEKLDVIPIIDHGRIEYFCTLFMQDVPEYDQDIEEDFPDFFEQVRILCTLMTHGM